MKGQEIPLAKFISSFFTSYLSAEKGVSPHTIRSYAKSIALFIDYIERFKGIHIKNISTAHLNKTNVLDFLDWMFSSKTGKKFVTEKLGFITPFNTFENSDLPEDPLAKEVVRYMRDEKLETVPWIFTAFPSDEFKRSVGSSLLQYAQGNSKWNDVIETVKTKWKSERG